MDGAIMFVNQLVESWSNGFGRIVGIEPNLITVKWSYLFNYFTYYKPEEIGLVLRLYNKDETAYVDEWNIITNQTA
jgi:hypothetical protein